MKRSSHRNSKSRDQQSDPSKSLAERIARRARREERRQKQRIDNVARAKEMHAIRLHGDIPLHRTAIGTTGSADQIHIGCAGWFYWHWRNGFYPADLSTRLWFPHYASKFKTVELNAPFYSWPTLSTVHSWVRQAGRRKFIYSVKVSELITHVKQFKGTKTLIKDFSLIADILGPRMGCFLFQLPPSFHYSRAALDRIIEQLDPTTKNVVEFRHSSWWNTSVFKAFEKTGTIFCSCSGPRLPDELVKTAGDVYIRFHGVKKWYRHDYSTEELAVWVQRIRASQPISVWAYFNNDRDLFAIKNARTFRSLLKDPRH